MSTTTILLLSHDLGPGGAQRKIADVAAYLTEHEGDGNTTVYVVLEEPPPTDPDARALFDAVRGSVVRVLIRPRGIPYPVYCAWCTLRLGPRRIIGFLRGPGILAVLLRRLFWWRPMRVGISDDSFPSGAVSEQTTGPAHAAVVRSAMRRGYGAADWIAAASEAARADLVSTFSVARDRVVVSRNWVQTESPDSASPRATRASGIPQHGFDLVAVSRLVPVKNLSLLVETVAALRERRPSIRAAIVGGGPELGRLQALRAELRLDDHLTLAGWQRDVQAWLGSSRIFCVTSHHEGLPIAALEAMASGMPVLSTRYPGADEIVRDGETGFVCADRSEFVERALQLLADEPLRLALGHGARTFVTERYGPDNLRRFVDLIVEG